METIDFKDLKTGYIICEHSGSWLAKAIRFFTRSYWNHCITVICFGKIKYAYESKMIYQQSNLKNRLNNDKYLVKIPLFKYSEKEVKERALELLGSLYDVKGTFLQQMWYYLTYNITGKGKWIFKNNDKNFYCSEASLYLLDIADDDKSPEWIAENEELFETRLLIYDNSRV